jgi:predicted TIM-barrel fold metal-dependent hydrolase
MDAHFETWRKLFPAIGMKPSDYFRRQCVISTDPEEGSIEAVLREVGDDTVVWASDYPHPDAHFPGAVAKSFDTMKNVSAAAREKIFSSNAARLYGLSSGALGS